VSVLKPLQEKDEGIAEAGGWLVENGTWKKGLSVKGSIRRTMRSNLVSRRFCGIRLHTTIPPTRMGRRIKMLRRKATRTISKKHIATSKTMTKNPFYILIFS